MGEVVEYRVEKTLDELKMLVDFGLFNETHVREIVAKREKFEYALRRRTKNKLEYLNYIKFEMNLLNSIENYKKTVLKSTEQQTDDIDQKILRLQAKKLRDVVRSREGHISFLFKKLTTSFQFDKRLWIAYIDFAKERKWNTRASALYWRLLRVAGDDEDLWLTAANHESSVREDINSARKLLLMALRHKPNSKKLKSELTRLCESNTRVARIRSNASPSAAGAANNDDDDENANESDSDNGSARPAPDESESEAEDRTSAQQANSEAKQ